MSKRVVWFMLLLVAGLAALQFLPDLVVGDYELRRVDLIADIRSQSTDSLSQDQANSIDWASLEIVGNEYLQDFSGSDDSSAINRGLEYFYRKLDSAQVMNRPVRIAYFGDSFVEGDMLTEDLRALFQDKFGGRGVGYVPANQLVAGLRGSVIAKSGGWTRRSVIDPGHHDARMGLDGMMFVSNSSQPWLELNARKDMAEKHQDGGDLGCILYRPNEGITLTPYINGQPVEVVSKLDGNAVSVQYIEGDMSVEKWVVNTNGHGPVVVYGSTMESKHGVCLDNLALRNTTGMHLLDIKDEMYEDFLKARNYDLIILGYGLNIVSKKPGRDYSIFMRNTEKVIRTMARYSPGTTFLIVSIGDRAHKTMNGMESYPSMDEYVEEQRKMAQRLGICFWDMKKTMVSMGGIAEMVHHNPPLAVKDYTHINFDGGKLLAKRLFDDLMEVRELSLQKKNNRINNNRR